MTRLFALSLALAVPSLLFADAAAARSEPAPSPALTPAAFLRGGSTDTAAPAARWWDGLGDAQLTALIEQGLKDAPGIAAAQARIKQARAGLSAARAGLLPSINGSALYARGDLPADALGNSSGQIELFNLGFDAQWEVDLWGGKRRGVSKARAQADLAGARLADAQVSLSAEIARSYIGLRAREASLALLDHRHALESRIVDIAGQRYRAGTAPRQPVETAEMQLQQTRAEQARTAAEISVLRDSLAILTGQAPGALDSLAKAEIPLPPASVAIGDPAAMLARRPDIRIADRQLAMAGAQVGIERAKLFPQISFMGLIGIGGTSASDMFDTSQLSTIALPRLSWSFLDFGRTAAAIRGAKAGREAAIADYRGAVLAALQDAEAALGRYGAARITYARASDTLRHAGQLSRLQTMRAEAGTAAPLDALETDRQALNAHLAQANQRAELTLAYVSLAKALGLGWQADAPRP